MATKGRDRVGGTPVRAQVRDAVPADLDDLRRIFASAAQTNAEDQPLFAAHPELLEYGGGPVREGRSRVAVVDGRTVGFVSVAVHEASLELEDLFVDPDWMRRGIGRRLVDDVVATARALGRPAIEVDANRAAAAFYERVGFEARGETPVEHGAAIRMRRVLGGADA